MKFIKQRGVVVFALAMMSPFAQAQPFLADGVVAVVGKNVILKSDVEMQYENMRLEGFDREGGVCGIFKELLFEKLLLHQAVIDSIIVADEEVDQLMDRRINMLVAQMGGDPRRLEAYYKKTIPEIKDEMRILMKNQEIAQRVQRQIVGEVNVTPTEVAEFYRTIPIDSLPLINTEVEYAQIVRYPTVSREARSEAIERLRKLKERVEGGSSFSTMAILYSEDPGSAKNGGEYKGIKRGQFVKEFEAVAFNLQRGQISEPFETEYGYHIVILDARKGEELDLRHILIKPKVSPEDLDAAKHFLDSLTIRLNKKELTFAEAADLYSQDDETKYNGGIAINPQSGEPKWEVDQIDKRMFVTLEKLAIGEIAAPSFFRTMDGKEGFKLVKLLNRIDPHKANLKEDYQRIKLVAENAKRQEIVESWITNKLDETYIKINRNVFGCTFTDTWDKLVVINE
ncbi:MAG: peptidylprolyl isomerase [Schleiferiaceae bacterium]|nr:peptidylprolyl isomerase [Schleiferiaceae bacterium]